MLKGYALALFGVCILSPDALLIRLTGDDPWLISVWRGLLSGSMMLLVNQCLDRRDWSAQWQGQWRALGLVLTFNAISQTGFVYAITHALVADVLIILAFMPVLSALFSALFLREVVHFRTWVATAVCAVGLTLLMAQPEMRGQYWPGLLAAGVCAAGTAAQFVVIRSASNANLIVGVGLGNFLHALGAAFLVESFILTSSQAIPIAIMGLIVSPLSFVLLILSLRYISAAETALIVLLESVLGSAWVWWILSEYPSTQTLWAGTLILLALAMHGIAGFQQSRLQVEK